MAIDDKVTGEKPCRVGRDYLAGPHGEQWCKRSDCSNGDYRIPVEIGGQPCALCTNYFTEKTPASRITAEFPWTYLSSRVRG
jgi:hypothetical protein